MDRKSARKYRALGQLPSEARKSRTWRTWPDALVAQRPGSADKDYVQLLYLARHEGEARVEEKIFPRDGPYLDLRGY